MLDDCAFENHKVEQSQSGEGELDSLTLVGDRKLVPKADGPCGHVGAYVSQSNCDVPDLQGRMEGTAVVAGVVGEVDERPVGVVLLAEGDLDLGGCVGAELGSVWQDLANRVDRTARWSGRQRSW